VWGRGEGRRDGEWRMGVGSPQEGRGGAIGPKGGEKLLTVLWDNGKGIGEEKGTGGK
jgi:hypothetical protein